jgi:hypothetical protein
MDAVTSERLVELRMLLQEALARTGDRSIPGRHAALVLLDGVCEYAMALACNDLGIHRKQTDNFQVTLQHLRNRLGPKWTASGGKGVIDLHDTRNLAQHRGVRVDPAELPRWAVDAEQFVNALVSVTFGVALSELTFASMITHGEVREHLDAAEQALEAGQGMEALRCCMEGFEAARVCWRQERRDAEGSRPMAPMRSKDLTAPDVRHAVKLVEDYAEITPFAADLGEYVWLRSLIRTVEYGAPPTMEESRRAVTFVFSWVLRWEAFSARYTPDRYVTWRESLRPPETGEGHDMPVVIAATVEAEDFGPTGYGLVATLQLADVPNDDQGAWIWDIGRALEDAEALQKLGIIVRPPFSTVTREGKVVMRRLPRDVDARALVRLVESAIQAAARLAESRQRAAHTPASPIASEADVQAYREALATVTFGGVPVFDQVTATRPWGTPSPRQGPVEKFRIEAHFRDDLDSHFRNEFTRAGHKALPKHGIPSMGSKGWSIPDTCPPDQCAELMRAVAAEAEVATRTELQRQEATKNARERLERELKALVTPRRPGPPA